MASQSRRAARAQRGFSLIELMIASAIGIVVILAFTQITTHQYKERQSFAETAEFDAVVSMVRTAVGNPETCGNTVLNQPFSTDPATPSRVALTLPGGHAFGPGDSSLMPRWRVTMIELSAKDGGMLIAPGHRLYTASLRFAAEKKNPKASIGSPSKASPEISLTVIVNTATNIVQGCNVAPDSPEVRAAACAALGGTFNGTIQKCHLPPMNSQMCATLAGKFDEATKTCALPETVAETCNAMGGRFDENTKACAVSSASGGPGTLQAQYRSTGKCQMSCTPNDIPVASLCVAQGGGTIPCTKRCTYNPCQAELVGSGEPTISRSSSLMGSCRSLGNGENTTIRDVSGRAICPPACHVLRKLFH